MFASPFRNHAEKDLLAATCFVHDGKRTTPKNHSLSKGLSISCSKLEKLDAQS
jgi:hypothetical protein